MMLTKFLQFHQHSWLTCRIGLPVGVLLTNEGLTQIPLRQVPKGIELHGVASGKYFGEGQLRFELQDTTTSQLFSLSHKQEVWVDASL